MGGTVGGTVGGTGGALGGHCCNPQNTVRSHMRHQWGPIYSSNTQIFRTGAIPNSSWPLALRLKPCTKGHQYCLSVERDAKHYPPPLLPSSRPCAGLKCPRQARESTHPLPSPPPPTHTPIHLPAHTIQHALLHHRRQVGKSDQVYGWLTQQLLAACLRLMPCA